MKKIDLQTWPRRTHYEFFKNYDMAHFGLTADVDVANLLRYAKEHQKSFFGLVLHNALKAVMEIEEFRTRIRGEEVVLHDIVHPSFTVLSEENLVMFVPSEYSEDQETFLSRVSEDIAKARSGKELIEEYGRDDRIYFTSLPWISYSQITHPYDTKTKDSFPRISWGKYHETNGKTVMPMSVNAHHALCDGYHAACFFQSFQKHIDELK